MRLGFNLKRLDHVVSFACARSKSRICNSSRLSWNKIRDEMTAIPLQIAVGIDQELHPRIAEKSLRPDDCTTICKEEIVGRTARGKKMG